jgi:glycosyltransferase involved in cell wall biosynthesis
MTRPRVLFLCHTLPYPPDGGVWIRTYHVLRLLSEAFDVTALCFERPPNAQRLPLADSMEALRRLGHVEVFPLRHGSSRSRRIQDHLRSLLSARVFTVYKHESRRLRHRLGQLLESESFDLVHLDSLDLSAFLPMLEHLPVACVHHNLESELLRRRAIQERNPLTRWLVGQQALLQEAEERRWCDRIAVNVMVSDRDRELLQEAVPGATAEVVPNGVDTEHFKPVYDGADGLVFVGSTGWYPNRDALEFFSSEILPKVRERRPDVRARWIGGATDAEIRRFDALHGIELTGYVEDIRPLVQRAACYVVPLRVGGGTRLKILDAWAMGKAVVSTAVGCEGLTATHDDNIMIAGDAESFAAAVLTVLEDRELRTRLGRSARSTAATTYSWDAIGKGLIQIYRALL